MRCLHQLNTATRLNTALPLMTSEDGLLLLEAATSLARDQKLLATLPQGMRVFVLEKDIQARALTPLKEVEVINDSQWVALTLEAERVCSW